MISSSSAIGRRTLVPALTELYPSLPCSIYISHTLSAGLWKLRTPRRPGYAHYLPSATGASPGVNALKLTRLRHSRSDNFERVLEGSDDRLRYGRWTDVADDPNSPTVIVSRADVLRASWRPAIDDRTEFLVDRCRGRRVLDVGCVAHDVERMKSPEWLHQHLAQVAATCLGLDVVESGVAAMNDAGYNVVLHDATQGPGPLSDMEPFDVIVAGELIEHVGSVDMLFELASQLLSTDGALIISTPNPWAPHRVRAGQLGLVWENVDHILYAFPSGIAELAERHGLVLAEASTTQPPRRSIGIETLKHMRRRLRGRQWLTVGISTIGERQQRRVGDHPMSTMLRRVFLPRRQFIGETFVYVVQRGAA